MANLLSFSLFILLAWACKAGKNSDDVNDKDSPGTEYATDDVESLSTDALLEAIISADGTIIEIAEVEDGLALTQNPPQTPPRAIQAPQVTPARTFRGTRYPRDVPGTDLRDKRRVFTRMEIQSDGVLFRVEGQYSRVWQRGKTPTHHGVQETLPEDLQQTGKFMGVFPMGKSLPLHFPRHPTGAPPPVISEQDMNAYKVATGAAVSGRDIMITRVLGRAVRGQRTTSGARAEGDLSEEDGSTGFPTERQYNAVGIWTGRLSEGGHLFGAGRTAEGVEVNVVPGRQLGPGDLSHAVYQAANGKYELKSFYVLAANGEYVLHRNGNAIGEAKTVPADQIPAMRPLPLP